MATLWPSWQVWAILLAGSFLPALLWMLLIRNTERLGREPLRQVFRAFVWGAVIAVIVAIALSLLVILVVLPKVQPLYEFLGERRLGDPTALIAVIVVAPFVEEFAKALAVLRVRARFREVEDGLVYGASAGLGFAATENLFYGLAALLASESLFEPLVVLGVRAVSSALLHASATASTGYGLAKRKRFDESAAPNYLLAVLMHAGFNLLASFGILLSDPDLLGEWAGLIGLLGAVLLAGGSFVYVRRIIREKD